MDRLGITVGDSEPPAPGRRDLSTRPEIATALRGRRTVGTRSSSTLRSTFLYVAVPVASQGTVLGAVRITYPTATVDARVRRLSLALAGTALVVLAAVALVGSWLARSVTRPLRGLERATDQGPGMIAEQRERAFDRFWRAAPADEEGTGLGLAIVRQLADASGGEAELRPARGGGLDAVIRLRSAHHTRTPGHRQGLPAWVASGTAWSDRR